MFLEPIDGAIEVSEEQWRSIGPDCKYVDGVVIPPPEKSEEEKQRDRVAQADAVKSTLQREAEDAIKPLERAKSLGIATPQELALLSEWEKYSVYLMRVDTSTAPNITWPAKPAAV
ncbi:MAG: tail fiber assembly protein [Plesiomonas shigelloides]